MIPTAPGKKAVLYCRVSSKEQEESGYSLPAQQKFLKEHADKNGLEVVNVFSISESASGRIKRNIFNEMMQYVTTKRINNIIVETTDRLTRNFSDVPVIDRWVLDDGTNRIHLSKEGCVLHRDSKSHEWFMWRVKVATAEYYVRLLSENVKKGQKEKLSQGWLPSKARIGYKIIGDKGHKIHVLDEQVAPHIRKMFEWYATGNYSLARLENELYNAGLRTENGKRLCTSRLHRLLREPFYYGKIRWSGSIHDGSQQPLISKDLFDKVQRVLKRQIENPHYRKHSPLFKSKIYCEHCSGILTWETQKGHWYGHCNNHGPYRRCSKKTYIREEKVEDQVISYFSRIAPANEEVLSWIEELIKDEEAGRVKERENETKRLTALLEQARRRLDRLYEDKIDEKISSDFYQRKSAEYAAEEGTLNEALARLTERTDEDQQVGIAIHRLGYNAKEIYEKALPDEKRLLLSEFFTNLFQNAYEIRPNYSLAGKYLTDWVQRLNDDYEPQKNVAPQQKRRDLVLSSPSWREWRDSLRTLNWANLLDDPEEALKQINQLLALICESDGLIAGAVKTCANIGA
jgi:site-specific DNA recombinase